MPHRLRTPMAIPLASVRALIPVARLVEAIHRGSDASPIPCHGQAILKLSAGWLRPSCGLLSGCRWC